MTTPSVLSQDENNELVASETDAFAIADFINVRLYLYLKIQQNYMPC